MGVWLVLCEPAKIKDLFQRLHVIDAQICNLRKDAITVVLVDLKIFNEILLYIYNRKCRVNDA